MLLLLMGLLFLARAVATAQSVEELYRGKAISMIVGGGMGGGYDVPHPPPPR